MILAWAAVVIVGAAAVAAAAYFRHRDTSALIEAWKFDRSLDLVGALRAVNPRAIRLPRRGLGSAS